MISIREVARLAGVSPSTVSRVLNGTAKVDEEKAKKVQKVIEETGFVPNEVARSLFKKSSKIIGLVIPNVENPFFSELVKVIEEEAYQNGYRVLLCNTGNNKEKESRDIQMLTRMNAAGILLISADEQLGPEVDEFGIPIVTIDRRLPKEKGVVCILADHYEGGRIATEHMIQCGCKNIVNVCGPQVFSSARTRYEGYKSVCAAYHIKEKNIECGYTFEDGLVAAEEILKKYPETDGVIACNDMVALAIYKVFQREGHSIPEKVQLIGFDDIALARFVTPEITTVEQPIQTMGKKAMERMIREIKQKSEGEEIIFPVKLVERETTKKKQGM